MAQARGGDMNALQWLNFLLCLAGLVVALFVAFRMRKDTELQIVLSFATIAAGLGGNALGYFRPGDWQEAFYTLQYGGLLALMIGTRKSPNWVAPRWIRPISISVTMGVWCAFLLGVA